MRDSVKTRPRGNVRTSIHGKPQAETQCAFEPPGVSSPVPPGPVPDIVIENFASLQQGAKFGQIPPAQNCADVDICELLALLVKHRRSASRKQIVNKCAILL